MHTKDRVRLRATLCVKFRGTMLMCQCVLAPHASVHIFLPAPILPACIDLNNRYRALPVGFINAQTSLTTSVKQIAKCKTVKKREGNKSSNKTIENGVDAQLITSLPYPELGHRLRQKCRFAPEMRLYDILGGQLLEQLPNILVLHQLIDVVALLRC